MGNWIPLSNQPRKTTCIMNWYLDWNLVGWLQYGRISFLILATYGNTGRDKYTWNEETITALMRQFHFSEAQVPPPQNPPDVRYWSDFNFGVWGDHGEFSTGHHVRETLLQLTLHCEGWGRVKSGRLLKEPKHLIELQEFCGKAFENVDAIIGSYEPVCWMVTRFVNCELNIENLIVIRSVYSISNKEISNGYRSAFYYLVD